MKAYLVGGAVRDRLLGRAGGDRDWVVVGSTPEEMLALGYKAIGRDFPVFLHPESNEEYALARTERKAGRGYRGFVVDADPSVTLEEDLARRDLTINAIAESADGSLIDPFGGAADIAARVLRHVSDAFAEDPVRLLRLARFAARFAPMGFTVAPETLALGRAMVARGEIDHLVPERVWQELRKALGEPQPSAFLRVLRDCHALDRILPEVDALYGVPQPPEHHPEVDTGLHAEQVLDAAARSAPGDALIGFAALVHDLGKALTPKHELPRHVGHEHSGLAAIETVCARLKVPGDYRELALIACREHLNVHRLVELRPATVHDLIVRCDGLRRPERIAQLALVCQADAQGRLGRETAAYPPAARLLAAQRAMLAVSAADIDTTGLTGPGIGERLRQARIDAVRSALD
jgi:tRNA nucleotidyltransferase (CCA-adding enzyme)